MLTEKAREGRLRRKLAKTGHRLCKTPRGSWLHAYYGAGYMIVNASNIAVSGIFGREYSDTLEDAEAFAATAGGL